jgi:hypothetical protein
VKQSAGSGALVRTASMNTSVIILKLFVVIDGLFTWKREIIYSNNPIPDLSLALGAGLVHRYFFSRGFYLNV